MRSRNLNLCPDKLQAMDILLKEGLSIAEIARRIGCTAGMLYTMRSRLGLTKKRVKIDHLTLQRQSGTPPEVYTFRAGIKLATLRDYASNEGVRLPLAGKLERREWWANTFRHHNVSQWNLTRIAGQERWPLKEAAKWLHLISTIQGTWVYGTAKPFQVQLKRTAIPQLGAEKPTRYVLVNQHVSEWVNEDTMIRILNNEGVAA